MLGFCLHSLFREYGWQFFRHVALRHPVRTLAAFLHARRYDFSGDMIATFDEVQGQGLGGPRSVVGVGFCLKPLDPPCMSGRSNHDCHYLERLAHSGTTAIPDCCTQCAIREIGLMARRANAAFYIMTSARDILFDVYVPALNEGRFSSGLFLLCRYSLEPFAVGLLASGIRGRLFAFERGDCTDYKTWLLADRGVKEERTAFSEQTRETIKCLLENAAAGSDSLGKFNKQGNILCPE